MTQDELETVHVRIKRMMDHTMALHAESATFRCIGTNRARLREAVAFALTVVVMGAIWSIGCMGLVRALL